MELIFKIFVRLLLSIILSGTSFYIYRNEMDEFLTSTETQKFSQKEKTSFYLCIITFFIALTVFRIF